MRILFINTYYYPNLIGGTERVLQTIAECLQKQGHHIAVYSIDGVGSEIHVEQVNGVTVYRGTGRKFDTHIYMKSGLPFTKRIKKRIIELCNFSLFRDLKYVISGFSPDVIHTQNLYGFSFWIWKELRKFKIPIVHTIHDYWLLKIYNRSTGKCFSKYVNYVTAPSAFVLKKCLDEGYFKKVPNKVVSNGINFNDENVRKIIAKRRKNIMHRGNFRFLFVGQIAEIKGIRCLLEMFSKFPYDDVELYLCGDGELNELVREYAIKDARIIFKGKLRFEKLTTVYKSCDVLIIPSVWEEPFGMVALEGNYYGLPVIASKRGGLQQIVENVGSGLLFEPNHSGELTTCMEHFLHGENYEVFYKNIELNLCQYDRKIQVDRFVEIYKQLSD